MWLVTNFMLKGYQYEAILTLLSRVTTRQKMFDVALVATLKDNGISGLYTVNVSNFEEFDFLEVVNPLKTDNE